MTKSNRRGPKKMGRTRKARSRRYGGATVGPAAAFNGLPGGAALGPAAAFNGLPGGAAGGGSNVILGNGTRLENEYAKIQGSYYTKFGSLAKNMPVNDGKRDPYSIVALLYLIKYHMVPDDQKAAVQAEFEETLTKIGEMTQSKSAEINQAVEAIVGREAPFVVIEPGNTALRDYVNQILGVLNPIDPPA